MTAKGGHSEGRRLGQRGGSDGVGWSGKKKSRGLEEEQGQLQEMSFQGPLTDCRCVFAAGQTEKDKHHGISLVCGI